MPQNGSKGNDQKTRKKVRLNVKLCGISNNRKTLVVLINKTILSLSLNATTFLNLLVESHERGIQRDLDGHVVRWKECSRSFAVPSTSWRKIPEP